MIRAGLPVVVADSEDPDHGSGGSSGGHRGTQTRQQPGNDRSTE
jgi:hypothetical protein